MERKSRMSRLIAFLMTAALLCACISLTEAESADQIYIENEWNYVDGSMDISHGIPDNATGVLDRIRRKGVLRVATEPYYPPQEFIDPDLEGQDAYVGADMKLARLIAERMGVEGTIILNQSRSEINQTTHHCIIPSSLREIYLLSPRTI